jgi:phosphatidylglycerol:prolipoprotein diacylglycerol transferase
VAARADGSGRGAGLSVDPELGARLASGLLAAAALLGAALPAWLGRRDRVAPAQLLAFDAAVAVIALAGAKLYFVVVRDAQGTAASGYGAPGAFLAVFLVGPLLWRALPAGLAPARWLDLVAPGACFGVALLRAGCWLVGCCHGRVSDLPWAVAFPALSPAWLDQLRAGVLPPGAGASLPVHPLQLYFAAAAAACGALALGVLRRSRRPGRAFLAGAGAYAGSAFALEWLREPWQVLVPWGYLTVGVGALALAAGLAARGRAPAQSAPAWAAPGSSPTSRSHQ